MDEGKQAFRLDHDTACDCNFGFGLMDMDDPKYGGVRYAASGGMKGTS